VAEKRHGKEIRERKGEGEIESEKLASIILLSVAHSSISVSERESYKFECDF